MSVFDAFLFRDEFICLDVRLHELEGVVDRHLLVEADWTLQGNPKPLAFTDRFNKDPESWRKWPMIIKTLSGDLYPNGSSWAREAAMREAILEGLAGAQDSDYVILNDVDEVPEREAVTAAIELLEDTPGVPSVAFQQEPRFYRFNNRVVGMKSYRGSQVMTVSTLRRNGAERMRENRWNAPPIDPGGWHFCNLGDADAFIRKLQTFAHEELNTPENTDRAFVEELISKRRVLGRDDYECVLDNGGLPVWVQENRDSFPELFYEEGKVHA